MISRIFWPLLTCIVMAVIHAYFGHFVIRRGLLFMDLALAQWAAIGYLVSHWLGVQYPLSQFLVSFGFALGAASILAVLTRLYDGQHLQEATIGILYIAGSALAVTFIASTGMEGHHLQEMLSGQLLFINALDFAQLISLYGIVSVWAWRCYPMFQSNQSLGSNLLFYGLFAIVVTSSVKLIGILLVFSFLVLPVMTVFREKAAFGKQLFWSSFVGVLGSFMGILTSIWLDLPPSFTVILVLVLIWVLSLIVLKEKGLKNELN